MGVIPDQFQKGPKWERAYKPTILRANLGNDTVSVTGGVFEDYGVTVITIPKPLFPVNVAAWGQCWVINTVSGGAVDSIVRVAISLDGGSVFTVGQVHHSTVNPTVAIFRMPYAPHHLASGLPTGDIVVKMQIAQAGGVAGENVYNDGSLLVQVTPLP